ncbi:MAG: hypothetical protein QOK40_3345 [Miltoncostaeaceae bacterium]|nr:hypothetical protein [Miltoncostaeaceae bacterium]
MMTTLARRAAPARAEREEAALRRLAAVMRAEAAELPPGCWVRRQLEGDVALGGWGDLVLPELARLVHEDEPDPDHWTRRRDSRSPLAEEEEAVLRRISALMRAEAAELDAPRSGLARRLDGWGIRLALVCERGPRGPRGLSASRHGA